MTFKVGDYVTRDSYNNDIVFVIVDIKNDEAILKGFDLRLIANSPLSDLRLCTEEERQDDFFNQINNDADFANLDRCTENDFFYLPPKILHLDGDNDYLDKCLEFYKKNRIMAFGKTVDEKELEESVVLLLNEIKPDILIITGHDSYNKKANDIHNLNNYKNSINFVKAVKAARKYEKSHEKLLIIAGACQSNYEELIKAGADFASSPKRVNIHALDPAIIATAISLTEKNKEIDLIELLKKTKYGKDGMGGLIVNGLMYVGYPR
ncbi:MAG: sporulation peptidase YabG [Candidatus Coprovivens sp.]